MEWKTIAPIVGAVAPLAGSILGGVIPFPGGSMIGQKFGEIIARQLGVEPTPQAVNEKLATSAEETKRAVITSALEKARAEIDGFVAYERAVLEAQVKNLTDVNVTIREEAENRVKYREHWFFTAWRPAIAWGFGSVYISFGVMLTVVTAIAAWRSPNPLATLQEAWPLFLAYFGPGGLVLGVLIPSRSIEKKTAIENAVPMPNARPPIPTTGSGVKPAPVLPKPSLPIATRPVTARADG